MYCVKGTRVDIKSHIIYKRNINWRSLAKGCCCLSSHPSVGCIIQSIMKNLPRQKVVFCLLIAEKTKIKLRARAGHQKHQYILHFAWTVWRLPPPTLFSKSRLVGLAVSSMKCTLSLSLATVRDEFLFFLFHVYIESFNSHKQVTQ